MNDKLLKIRTLRELKTAGYQTMPVRMEMRKNLLERLHRAGKSLRGKARDGRRFGGGPDRRDRSDQGGRGALPGRRGNDPLRIDPAHQSRHLRNQRAA